MKPIGSQCARKGGTPAFGGGGHACLGWPNGGIETLSTQPSKPWLETLRRLAGTVLTPAARVGAIATVAIVHVLLVYWVTHETLPAGAFDLRRAERAPAGAASGWSLHALPDRDRDPKLAGREVWYRMSFSLAEVQGEPLAIYLGSSSAPATVLLNGVRLNPLGEAPDRAPRFWDQPSLYLVSEAALLDAGGGPLLPGRSELLVRIRADDSGRLALGAAAVGLLSDMEPLYRRAYLARVTAPRLIAFSMVLGGLLFFLLWRRRRSDAVYAWFVMAMLLWAVHTGTYVIDSPPLPPRLWEWLRLTTLMALAASAPGFVHSYLNRPDPRLQRRLWISVGGAATLLAILAATPVFYVVADYIWPVLSIAISLAALPVLVRTARRWPDPEAAWLGAGGAMVLILAAHDVLTLGGWWPGEEILVLPYAAPVTIIAFVSILLTRFARALNEAESLNVELESRVAEREGELKLSYDRLRAIEREQDLDRERERIMRDMHDGVGGHLVSLLAGIENRTADPQVLASRITEALEDLRLMIHSLDSAGEDLDTALAALRPKLETLLAAGGVELDWRVAGPGEGVRLGPSVVLQMMRVVQEATTNALKHAQASRVTIGLESEVARNERIVRLSVHDNGRGISGEPSAGRGLANIRKRTAMIGGRVDIRSSAAGTTIELQLALPASVGDGTTS